MLETLIAELQRENAEKSEKISGIRADAERAIYRIILENAGSDELPKGVEKDLRHYMKAIDLSPAQLAAMVTTAGQLLTVERIAAELPEREAAYRDAVDAEATHRAEISRFVESERAKLSVDVESSRCGAGEAGDRMMAISQRQNESFSALPALTSAIAIAEAAVREARAAASTALNLRMNNRNLDAVAQHANELQTA